MVNRKLNNFTSWLAEKFGRAFATVLAILLIIVWLPSILIIGDFDTWQLVINTITTIVTFVMAFVIHNTQTRDNASIQVKLDAIIENLGINEEEFVDLETLTDTELEKIQKVYQDKGRRNEKEE